MSHYNKLFNLVPVQIQNRSGFDMSHSRYFTATVGTLTPCLCTEVLPGDKITLGTYGSVKLPPFASDFVGRIDAHFEYFFVPNRIIFGGWQRLMTAGLDLDPGTPVSVSSVETIVPNISSDLIAQAPVFYGPYFSIGSLADYLGFRLDVSNLNEEFRVSLLPFLAYHKIWDDWYRDSRLQKPCFPTFFDSASQAVYNAPFGDSFIDPQDVSLLSLYNGVNLFSLHQRNFMKDYFVNASLRPQSSNASSLRFSVEDGSGSFTIAALRAANSLQMFMERNNIAGFKYSDQIRAQFGVTPSDAVLNKAIYLGRVVLPVYNSAVVQTSNSTGTETSSRFKSVGASYGRAAALGDGSVFNNFEATEHGYLIGIFSLVPHAVYSTTTSRSFARTRRADFAFPLLAGVGDQEIYEYELSSVPEGGPFSTFGYTQRYSDLKYIDDTVHGLLRDGGNLSYMVLQRSFANADMPVLSSSFIEIPTNYLDDVFAASNEVSGFSCWVNLYHSLKMSRVLPAYSIPTLENPSDVHTEMIPNGGKRL